jgi:hypothetical protein
VRVVKLLDGLDSLHKFWKLLELRPLVVGLLYGDLNLNRIRDLGHEPSLGVMSIKDVPARNAPPRHVENW